MTAPARVYVRQPGKNQPAVASVPVWPDSVEYIRADIATAAIVLAAVSAAGSDGLEEDRLKEIFDRSINAAVEAFS